MKKRTWFSYSLALAAISGLFSLTVQGQDISLPNKLTGKWTQEMVGARTGGAILNITAVDPATGRITGKYIPPSGPAIGKEFDVVGWIAQHHRKRKLIT